MNHKNRNFFKFMLLWAGELISAIGSGLTSFGLGVYVFRQTGSAADMALVTLLGFLTSFLLSIPAGVLADRYDRRLLMMIGDGCSALGILYIWICMMNGKAALYQICIGVFVSSVFSSLLEPSYQATVTDLLSKEEYSRASGMVSIAGSARYLISPILAGALLAVKDIEFLLLLDISTFVLTVAAAAVVRKGMERKMADVEVSFTKSFRQGWTAITERRGVLILILVSSVITCFMGVLQILAEPLILDFSDSTTLGIGETVCACGILVWLKGQEIIGLSEDEKAYMRLHRMGFVFQQMNMMANLNLMDNILLPAIQANREKRKDKRSRAELVNEAKNLMEKLSVAELAGRRITEVSGGQLQRACICRSLMNHPQILFADEPTGALNQSAASEVMDELVKLNREEIVARWLRKMGW